LEIPQSEVKKRETVTKAGLIRIYHGVSPTSINENPITWSAKSIMYFWKVRLI